jgi:hypothetical protein
LEVPQLHLPPPETMLMLRNVDGST